MNIGKKFERQFTDSIPKDVYLLRIHDPPQSFNKEASLRFSLSNPYDFLLYKHPTLFVLELKSTMSALSFWRADFVVDGKKQTFVIKKNQIEGLARAAEHSGIVAGFIINFRNDNETYFLGIDDFLKLTSNSNKKSLNRIDVSLHGLLIKQEKLRTNYRFDIADLIARLGAG